MTNKSFYPRGSIWWCSDYLSNYCQEGVQGGCRPVLIISSNHRGKSPSVEVVKLTTSDKSHTCRDINIPVMVNGVLNYVMCNQHFTVNISSLTKYICTLDSKTMSRVENGLLESQGMSHLVSCNTYLKGLI